ncbi:hypothetical protein [Streptomyces sp. NPDC006510]
MNARHGPVPGSSTTSRTADRTTTPVAAGLVRGALEPEHTEHGVLPYTQ